jgi:FkbM family methyltransferase
VRRLALTIGRLAPPSLRDRIATTRLGRVLAGSIDEGAYEPEVQAALTAIVRPGWTCADVGAHRGLITRHLARLVGPEGEVIAFEAHPDNARELFRLVESEKLGATIRVENFAVNDGSRDRVNLHRGRGRATDEWNIMGRDLEGRTTPAELEVPAVSLDAYFKATTVDLVKIDVEGAEGAVFTGMRRLLRENRPTLVIEFHDAAAWARRQELVDAGYDLYEIDGTRLSGSDVARRYHCLALPSERPLTERLG